MPFECGILVRCVNIGFDMAGERMKTMKYIWKRHKWRRQMRNGAGSKRCLFLFVLCLSGICLSGCGGSRQPKDGLVVYTSIYPVYDFTVKLAGEYATVENLVPEGVEPHDFEMGTQDMVKLAEADLLVYSGAGMENWVDKSLKTLGGDAPKAVEAAGGIALLEEEGAKDPHVWLDPANAMLMLENIKNALCELDPSHAETFEANYKKYERELSRLDEGYRDALKRVSKRDIVVSHASFGYLCAAYGLTQKPVEGLMADSEPDPAAMSEIILFMKEQDIGFIFDEELVNNKVVDTIAKETGAVVEILDPIEGLSGERIQAGEDYFSVMEKNLSVLEKALQ